MNKINPKKLLGSKWTAVKPRNQEKHYMVSDVKFDEEDFVLACSIEAVISKRTAPIDWHELKNESNWIHGWK
jgi:tryptophan-rich hypothetical protein